MKNKISFEEKLEIIKDQPFGHFKDANIYSHIGFNILREAHLAMKIVAMRYNISASEIFREFVERLITGDKYLMKMIYEMQDRKLNNTYKELVNYEAEEIYKIIEQFEQEEDLNKKKEEKTYDDEHFFRDCIK